MMGSTMTNPHISAAEIQFASPEKTLKAGVGFASPLWPAFAAVAGAGIAYWWMSELSKRAFRFEAMPLLSKSVALAPKSEALSDAVEGAPVVAHPAAEPTVSAPSESQAVKQAKPAKIKREVSEPASEGEIAPARKPAARKPAVRKAAVAEG